MTSQLKDELNIVVDKLLAQWGEDNKTKNLKEKVEEWIQSINTFGYGESTKVFLRLLDNFEYYSAAKINHSLVELYTEFQNIEKYHSHSVYIPIVAESGDNNSSYTMVSLYRNTNNIHKSHFIMDLQRANSGRDLTKVNNIVIIDDMSGTGDTIKKYLERLIKHHHHLLKNKKIYILLIICSSYAIDNINSFSQKHKLNIKIVSLNVREKAFKEGYIFDSNVCSKYQKLVEELETSISVSSNRILGYKNSQLLLAFNHNTPNNTLPIFWWNRNKKWNAIFPRQDPIKPPFQDMFKRSKRQKSRNYFNAARG